MFQHKGSCKEKMSMGMCGKENNLMGQETSLD